MKKCDDCGRDMSPELPGELTSRSCVANLREDKAALVARLAEAVRLMETHHYCQIVEHGQPCECCAFLAREKPTK